MDDREGVIDVSLVVNMKKALNKKFCQHYKIGGNLDMLTLRFAQFECNGDFLQDAFRLCTTSLKCT